MPPANEELDKFHLRVDKLKQDSFKVLADAETRISNIKKDVTVLSASINYPLEILLEWNKNVEVSWIKAEETILGFITEKGLQTQGNIAIEAKANNVHISPIPLSMTDDDAHYQYAIVYSFYNQTIFDSIGKMIISRLHSFDQMINIGQFKEWDAKYRIPNHPDTLGEKREMKYENHEQKHSDSDTSDPYTNMCHHVQRHYDIELVTLRAKLQLAWTAEWLKSRIDRKLDPYPLPGLINDVLKNALESLTNAHTDFCMKKPSGDNAVIFLQWSYERFVALFKIIMKDFFFGIFVVSTCV